MDAGSSSSRFESPSEDEFNLPSTSSHHRNVQPRRRLSDDAEGRAGGGVGAASDASGNGRMDAPHRRGAMDEVDDEPLIILDPYAADATDQPIGAPLDLRRELAPGTDGKDEYRCGRRVPFVKVNHV